MENQYNIRHAREILKSRTPAGYLLFNDNGVWPGEAVKEAANEQDDEQDEAEFLRWRPADHLQHLPDATEPASTPMLPNPFNARELAAFMLGGIGVRVRCEYGEWVDGPSKQSLKRIDRQSYARRAVTEAFDAYRLAIERVGKSDADALARRDAAHTAYWKSNNDKALLKAFDEAQAEWDAAYAGWLTAMVVCLLEKPQAATEAPAVAVSTSDKPGSRKIWTPEKLEELAAYRARYTMAETAVKFSISEQRIRKLLPSAKPKASPFPGVIHRLK